MSIRKLYIQNILKVFYLIKLLYYLFLQQNLKLALLLKSFIKFFYLFILIYGKNIKKFFDFSELLQSCHFYFF